MSRRPILTAAAVIVFAGLLAYHNSFSGSFVFDDASSVVDNASIRALWPPGRWLTPAPECTVAGRPVANLTFALNYAWGGLSVSGYHAVNLVLHVVSGLLLFGIVRRTLARLGQRPGDSGSGLVARRLADHALPLAFASALLWTVHPLASGTVNYISQRTELLMALFYLFTLYAFIRGVESDARGWLAASWLGCLAGMGSKEVMVTAPVLVLVYDWAFVAGALASAWRRRWLYYVALALTWVVLASLMVGLERRAVGFGLGVSWLDYAITECKAVVTYLRLAVWPHPLVWDYGPLFLKLSGANWGWLLAVVGLLAAGAYAWVRERRIGFLAVAFFIILAPTSSVVPVAAQPIAENRAYLPSAAVVVLAVTGVFVVLGRTSPPVLLFVVLASITNVVQRNRVLQDLTKLWLDTVVKAPMNPRAHENLGEIWLQKGDLTAARAAFEAALRLKDDYPELHNNYGVLLHRLGDGAGALRHFEAAIRLRPEAAEPHDHLGNLLLQLGRVGEAQAQFEEALRLRPEFPAALNNLGNALLAQGKVAEAQSRYREAFRLRPQFAQACMNLGVTLRQLGHAGEARAYFVEAVRLAPDLPEGRLALGVVLLEDGDVTGALREFEMALHLRPNFPEAHNNLANSLLKVGREPEARRHLEEALRLRPEYPDARATLNRLQEGESAVRKQ